MTTIATLISCHTNILCLISIKNSIIQHKQKIDLNLSNEVKENKIQFDFYLTKIDGKIKNDLNQI
jgi:hypothetical protein